MQKPQRPAHLSPWLCPTPGPGEGCRDPDSALVWRREGSRARPLEVTAPGGGGGASAGELGDPGHRWCVSRKSVGFSEEAFQAPQRKRSATGEFAQEKGIHRSQEQAGMGGLAVGKGKQKQPSWEPGHTAPAQTAGGEDSSGTSPGFSLGPAPVPGQRG